MKPSYKIGLALAAGLLLVVIVVFAIPSGNDKTSNNAEKAANSDHAENTSEGTGTGERLASNQTTPQTSPNDSTTAKGEVDTGSGYLPMTDDGAAGSEKGVGSDQTSPGSSSSGPGAGSAGNGEGAPNPNPGNANDANGSSAAGGLNLMGRVQRDVRNSDNGKSDQSNRPDQPQTNLANRAGATTSGQSPNPGLQKPRSSSTLGSNGNSNSARPSGNVDSGFSPGAADNASPDTGGASTADRSGSSNPVGTAERGTGSGSNPASSPRPYPNAFDAGAKEDPAGSQGGQGPTAQATEGEGGSGANQISKYPETYTVRKGQSMATIAGDVYGNRDFYIQIAQANPTIDPLSLRPGQRIKMPSKQTIQAVRRRRNDDKQSSGNGSSSDAGNSANTSDNAQDAPTTAGGTYTVQEGDSLSGIAKDYYNDPSKWRLIYQANRDVLGNNPDSVRAGDQLTIPPDPDRSPPTK